MLLHKLLGRSEYTFNGERVLLTNRKEKRTTSENVGRCMKSWIKHTGDDLQLECESV